MYQWI